MMRVEDTNQSQEAETSDKASGTLVPLLSPPVKMGQYEEWFELVTLVEQALALPLHRLGLLKLESVGEVEQVATR